MKIHWSLWILCGLLLISVAGAGLAVRFLSQPSASHNAASPDGLVLAMRSLDELQMDEAEFHLREYLSWIPTARQARDELRWLYFNQFRDRELEMLLEDNLRSQTPDPLSAVHLLMSEFRRQNPREILDYWEKLNRSRSDQANSAAALGSCYWQLGQNEEARTRFRQALELRRDDPRLRLLAAEFLVELGDSESAAALVPPRTAARSRLFDAENLTQGVVTEDQICWVESQIAEARSQVDRALESLERALEIRPRELRYLQRWGSLLQRNGKTDAARQAFAQANEVEQTVGRLTEIVLGGELDHPTAPLARELSELCRRRGRQLQAEFWRQAARELPERKTEHDRR